MQWYLSINLSWPSESCWLENSWVRSAVYFLIALSGNKRKKKHSCFLCHILSSPEFHGTECHSLTTEHMNCHLLFWVLRQKPFNFIWCLLLFVLKENANNSFSHFWFQKKLLSVTFSSCSPFLFLLVQKVSHDSDHVTFCFEDIDILQIYVMLFSNLLCILFLNNHVKCFLNHYKTLIWHLLLEHQELNPKW